MKIAVIIGSTRPGRKGATIGQWVHELAAAREDAVFELVDLKDFNLPLLSEPTVPGMAKGQYEVPETTAWAKVIDAYDGYVLVTAEYNHSIPGALKNALDVLSPEWAQKAVSFVSYGADGGVRAVEHLRAVVANLRLQATRGAASLSIFTDFDGDTFTPAERRAGEVNAALDELVKLTKAMKDLRES